MNSPIRNMLVVAVGLDLMHASRLKLACSLLLADRIDVTFREWSEGDSVSDMVPDLVVIDSERHRMPGFVRTPRTLSVKRIAHSSNTELKRGATTRDMHECLRGVLAQVDSGPPLLLRAMQSGTGGAPVLFRKGELRLLLDPARACLWLPEGLALDALVTLLPQSGWDYQPLEESVCVWAERLPRRCSKETLLFALAHRQPGALGQPPQSGLPLQLKQWPDLAEEASSSSWLVAIACLHAKPWRASALAEFCKLPLHAVESLFAAAAASGLAQFQETPMTRNEPTQRNTATSRFIGWVARRFGLNLPEAAA